MVAATAHRYRLSQVPTGAAGRLGEERRDVAIVVANPAVLRASSGNLLAIAEDLSSGAELLGGALDDFRASRGWSEFLSDVPPLDIDMGAVAGRIDRMSAFTAQVAAAFAAADDVDDGGRVRADEATVAALVNVSFAGDRPVLLRDGDRWIFPGTDGSDFVRIVADGDGYRLEVGVPVRGPDGRETLDWQSMALTDEQAANLVLRTGGGDDFVALPVTATIAFTVWTGAGNDVVGTPGRAYSSRLGGGGDDRVFTGDGDDRVEAGDGDDEVYAGAGDDYVDGQGGDDRIVGGSEADIVYGGAGDDVLEGAQGDDHLEGGRGADDLRGDAGRDLLSGGRDDDRLRGGDGDDDLLGGRGDDESIGGDGTDKVTFELGETRSANELSVTIELTGDPGSYAINTDPSARPDWMTEDEWEAWVERLDADLELLRTTETGRASLSLLDDAARDSDDWVPWDDDTRITILPYQPSDADDPVSFDAYIEAFLNDEPLPGEEDPDDPDAGDVTSLTGFDRSYAVGDRVSYGQANVADFAYGPPVLTLQHELSHAFDNLRGGTPDDRYVEVEVDADGNEVGRSEETISEAEINSVGLDLDGDGDPDTVNTDDGQHHPPVFTENALRDELRRPERDSYTRGTSDARAPGHRIRYEETDGDPVEADDEDGAPRR